MGYATDARFLLRVPDAASVSTTLREIALSDAAVMIDDELFGDKCERAHAMLAAHLLALDGFLAGGAAGVVVSHSAGEIAASYAVNAEAAAGDHSSTSYGRAFDEIARTVLHGPEVG